MSGLTPEAARAAAARLDEQVTTGWQREAARWFRAEADRLEDSAKTLGQVAFEMTTVVNPRPGWSGIAEGTKAYWERIAAAVAAHAIGDGNTIVARSDLRWMTDRFVVHGHEAARLREAAGRE